jgi:CDP-diacylglycerol--serine O-phosphatidyltransferase
MKFPSGTEEAFVHYQNATYLIFAACIFDLLDGRVARMCKSDGPFGREFDSIADVVSFGIAPAMLLAQAVLFNLEIPYLGWGIAVLYLLCAALRLARFNCMAAAPKKPNQSMDFVGLPVPMAAGAVVSTMYLVIDMTANRGLIIPPVWQYVMAAVMAVVAILMMSRVIYPSFKHVNFEKRGTAMAILMAVIAICAFIFFPWIAPAFIFVCYLGYGLVVRPFLTRRMRRAIEAAGDDEAAV